jgi:hypothetical protein
VKCPYPSHIPVAEGESIKAAADRRGYEDEVLVAAIRRADEPAAAADRGLLLIAVGGSRRLASSAARRDDDVEGAGDHSDVGETERGERLGIPLHFAQTARTAVSSPRERARRRTSVSLDARG